MSHFPGLTNHLLIAMPAMGDPNFHRTVTLVCEHSEEGALGIVINRPLDIRMGDIFEQLELAEPVGDIFQRHVLNGGPVQQERGFVLHRPKREWDSMLKVSDEIGVATSRDILAAIAEGDGPSESLVALGYAGWTAGQLEAEMQANAWLSAPATGEIVFNTPFESRWYSAARLVGVDIGLMSSEAGHA
ncbi:MAG: YqgE/AlgH family protein [Gammaproteobacteria bacterium]|nr:YqgE/AlgH family protein [Gammaproteobacteria bacterium]MDH3767175.1 YqgE/AlgH family protein [Gammaproteobacteria bacterium]